MVQLFLETMWHFLIKLDIQLQDNLIIALLGIYKSLYQNVCNSLIHIRLKLKQQKCPSKDEQLNKQHIAIPRNTMQQ